MDKIQAALHRRQQADQPILGTSPPRRASLHTPPETLAYQTLLIVSSSIVENGADLLDFSIGVEGLLGKIAGWNALNYPLQFFSPGSDLAKMGAVAKVLLSMPASSASVERVFSSAGLLDVPKRNRLGDTVSENLILCRQFLRQQVSTTRAATINKLNSILTLLEKRYSVPETVVPVV